MKNWYKAILSMVMGEKNLLVDKLTCPFNIIIVKDYTF